MRAISTATAISTWWSPPAAARPRSCANQRGGPALFLRGLPPGTLVEAELSSGQKLLRQAGPATLLLRAGCATDVHIALAGQRVVTLELRGPLWAAPAIRAVGAGRERPIALRRAPNAGVRRVDLIAAGLRPCAQKPLTVGTTL